MNGSTGSIKRRWVARLHRPAVVMAALALSATTIDAQTTYYVSPTGNDSNAGTLQAPFQTIQRGVNALQAPGDILELRGGAYVGSVLISNKHGLAGQPIVIRSYSGERASIDGYLWPQGGTGPAWAPASLDDAGAHPDEFVSTTTFNEASVNRGAFLQAGAYTRLVTYSRLEDLRAENATFERITSAQDPRPGPPVLSACAVTDTDPACQELPDCSVSPTCPLKRYKPAGYRRPWVYMGPGLWFNEATRRVHVRLSPTSNAIAGLQDYQGETDPQKVKLAVTGRHLVTLRVEHSSHMLVSNLDVRFGGDQTMWLRHVQDVTFDHVNVWAGARGVRTDHATRTAFEHCRFDGGVPGWVFRSDIKDAYRFLLAGRVERNGLAEQTSDGLMAGHETNAETRIAYSEFVNAHDLYLAGTGVWFHHNWIRNLHDDCLFLDAPEYGVADARIHENVIEQCLAGISMAGEEVGGPKYIYRNLFDLRLPTASFRPRNAGDRNVWRYGHPFKFRRLDGPIALFHNTFLVNPQHGTEESLQAALLHYRDTPLGEPLEHPRRSFNNIFVVNMDIASDVPITYLPDPSFAGPTDGNNYFRFGDASAAAFQIAGYCLPAPCPLGQTYVAKTFSNLQALYQSEYFQHSKGVYAPGSEAHSREADPRFESYSPNGSFSSGDDVRLSWRSPLREAGILLPKELYLLDRYTAAEGSRDIGCCPYGSAALRVGVDGRRTSPPVQ